jgi:hypothetical protein
MADVSIPAVAARLAQGPASAVVLMSALGASQSTVSRAMRSLERAQRVLRDRYEGHFELAPVYDMLPMLFAPQDDQLVSRSFEPPSPRAAWLSVWTAARALAESYWARLAQDSAISADFRGISAQCPVPSA